MVELEEFKYGGTNISAYRLVDPELEDVQNVVQDWVLGELRYGRKIPFQGKTIKVNTQHLFNSNKKSSFPSRRGLINVHNIV